MDNTINKLINKSEELTGLLKELQTSTEAEQYRYVLKFEYNMGSEDVYSLHDNQTGKVKLDRLQNINSWLNIRGIDASQIYKVV